MDKELVKAFRAYINKPFKLFIHKLVEKPVAVSYLTVRRANRLNELVGCKEAHIVDYDDSHCMYVINDEVYLIPARVKGIINNNDNKLNFVFEYPCEMKREDLVEY